MKYNRNVLEKRKTSNEWSTLVPVPSNMDYSIRELRQNESKVLNTFLYEAIFIPEGIPIPPKEIINQPELQVYVKDFGKNGVRTIFGPNVERC